MNRSSNKNNKNKKLFENKRKTEYKPKYTKSNSHLNFLNETQVKSNIKSMQVHNQRKRQNLFIKNKLKDKESLNLNININKIINQKDNSCIKGFGTAFSVISDSNKNCKSSNDNNKLINFFTDKDKISEIKKKRLDSDISNAYNMKILKINNNIAVNNYNNKNKQSRINLNNLIKINNINTKIQNKYSKEINYKKNNIKVKKNKKLTKIYNKKPKTNSKQNNNKEELYLRNNNINLNKNKQIEKDIIDEKNLCPAKKSLFSEHMNFLLNFNDDKNFNKEKNNNENNNNKNYNPNYKNNQFNSILQSTENKEFESKFINYDLGKTTGTSQIKDSLFVFGNDHSISNNEISKINKISNHRNYFGEEKERTRDELEKLAEQFLNISKIKEFKKNRNQIENSQTNTITTIIYNNIND